MINIISKQGAIQIKPPYDLCEELQSNFAFNNFVENDLIQGSSCCSLFSTPNLTEQKKVQKAAEILIRATLAEISSTSFYAEKNRLTRSVRIFPCRGTEEEGRAFIKKLDAVKIACLKADPTCLEEKWFKDFSKYITHLDSNKTPILVEQTISQINQTKPKS